MSTDRSDTHVVGYKGVVLLEHYHHRWLRIYQQACWKFMQACRVSGPYNGYTAEAVKWQSRCAWIEKLKPTNCEARRFLKQHNL